MDYFEFFELPRKLTLNVVALEKQFYTMSRRLHPDRFASKPLAEQEAALPISNVMLVCGTCGPVRVGHKFEGDTKVRVCKKCGQTLAPKKK